MIKRCSKCGETKITENFHARLRMKDGLREWCKACCYTSSKAWAAANGEKNNEAQRRWRAENREKNRAYDQKYYWAGRERVVRIPLTSVEISRRYREKNRQRTRDAARQYAKDNPEGRAFRQRTRDAAKRQAVPPWAEKDAIASFYQLASLVSDETGIRHHVDHIVPLKSKIVCGLHCYANLQVIPATENSSKGNRYWPDMP